MIDYEIDRRTERDAEREPRQPVRASRRVRQFRYWAGHMFRPVRTDKPPTPELFP